MRILLQRTTRAEVRVMSSETDGPSRVTARIGKGFVLLVGITHTDTRKEVSWMVDKIHSLRLFPDEDGRMNKDLTEHGGAVLVVSQFTLYGDTRKGRRPSFLAAAPPNIAESLYNLLIDLLRIRGLIVETGEFGATMEVELINDGPVTLWLEREAELPSPP